MDGVDWSTRLELFRFAIAAALLAGLVCPWVGCFLFIRRTSFHGITLPLFATVGVMFGFVVLPAWSEHFGLGGMSVEEALGDSHAAIHYHFAWATIFTLGGLAILVAAGRRGGTEIGRVAAAFAIAHAATILLGRFSPMGRGFVDGLLQGEILGVGVHEFEVLAAVLGPVALVLLVFHRDFVLVSYDRETAQVLGKRVLRHEAALHGVTAATVAVGSMILGPTLLFGLLVLPPLAARPFARSMGELFALSAAAGAAATVLGCVFAFELDLPLGAGIVGAAALLLVPGRFARRA